MSTPWNYNADAGTIDYNDVPVLRISAFDKLKQETRDMIGYVVADNLRNFNIYLDGFGCDEPK